MAEKKNPSMGISAGSGLHSEEYYDKMKELLGPYFFRFSDKNVKNLRRLLKNISDEFHVNMFLQILECSTINYFVFTSPDEIINHLDRLRDIKKQTRKILINYRNIISGPPPLTPQVSYYDVSVGPEYFKCGNSPSC